MPDRQQDLPDFVVDNEATNDGPVECLGMTFASEDERREYFREKLREKLQDPEFRNIEGFPIGSDEDILALSDPPYYTACPNPWLADIVAEWEPRMNANERKLGEDEAGKENDSRPFASISGSSSYHREPFAVDVSEGKTHAIYKAHSYHTKVPHLAIVPSILHYTEPGDVVLDGFAGSGMTGVAAQWCGTAPPDYRAKLEQQWKAEGHPAPEWGVRRCVLNDLAPAATFIAANYNLPFDVAEFARAAKQLLAETADEIGWMYRTIHREPRMDTNAHESKVEEFIRVNSCSFVVPKDCGLTFGRIEYTVWSEVFTCPECAGEVVFLDEALDPETKRVKDSFPCPHCKSELTKKHLDRRLETVYDRQTGTTLEVPKRRPCLICYRIGKAKYEKKPDAVDLAVLAKIAEMALPGEIPDIAFPFDEMWEAPRLKGHGITHTHHMFLRRAAQALGTLWRKANAHPDPRIRHMLMFLLDQSIWGFSILNRYGPTHFSQVNRQMTGVYYVPSQTSECSPWYNLDGKASRLPKAFRQQPAICGGAAIGTGSTAALQLPDTCIDYIFTDPPFGDNFPYAELNYSIEAWYGVLTSRDPEAVVDRTKQNRSKQKSMSDYRQLMQACLAEYYRVLKPGHWMTLVFSNSKNSVWHSIQEALSAAGFVVADVRALDKQQGSFKQVTSTAVKQDLIISAYRPNGGLEDRFALVAGTEDGAWDFLRTHLKQLPIFVAKDGRTEVIAERLGYLLYDRMVAFHVQRGVTVPMSSSDFAAGLAQRFAERDGMYFLPDQVAEYDRKRMTTGEIKQLELFVTDETSAIQWLRQQLTIKPQTFQELHPQFLKEIGGWGKHETALELSALLEENFLCYDGHGDVPGPIHSYLSTNLKMRNLPKDDPALRAKGKDRWYVPDPNKAGDLEKLRERGLLREFEQYKQRKKKFGRSERFRMEAVRAGFKKAWQDRDYGTIIAVAELIPESILQEDPKLLMWYDQAVTRSEG